MQKIIVVGAGILGASTAYQLAKNEVEVIIIDRQDAGQATSAAAGIVCPWISQRRNQAWYLLAKNGAAFYPGLIEELERDGETETGYAQVGAISLHTDEAKLNAMKNRAAKRQEGAPEMGVITLLSAEETRALFPPLSSEYAAVHVSGAARVDGRALRDSLLRASQKYGAKLMYGEAKLTYKDTQVSGVTFRDEFIPADKVIVCAGAWAPELLKPLGVNFQVTFQKAQIIHLEMANENTNNWPVVMPPSDQYLLAFDNNKIVAGATHENTEVFDNRMTAGGLQEVFNKALQTAPGLTDSAFVEARVGFRPFTPGFLPVMGPLPGWGGIIVANGLGASGLTMGPYIGSLLANLALDREIEIEIENYDVRGAL
ncbi:FAD-dependent oxidoreductase [Bacillus sp. AFS094228]|nr:FAD-dependent oxidoreductase [Bacillus sp. AFS094228]